MTEANAASGILYVFGIDGVRPCKIGATTNARNRLSLLRNFDKTHTRLGLDIDMKKGKFLYVWPTLTAMGYTHADEAIIRELSHLFPRLFVRTASKARPGYSATEWFDIHPDEMHRAVLRTRAFRKVSPNSYLTEKLSLARSMAEAFK